MGRHSSQGIHGGYITRISPVEDLSICFRFNIHDVPKGLESFAHHGGPSLPIPGIVWHQLASGYKRSVGLFFGKDLLTLQNSFTPFLRVDGGSLEFRPFVVLRIFHAVYVVLPEVNLRGMVDLVAKVIRINPLGPSGPRKGEGVKILLLNALHSKSGPFQGGYLDIEPQLFPVLGDH